jgi:hypothetical protein
MDSVRIPERFLRQLWQHQGFSTRGLVTSDGRRVRIRFPGIANTGGGPDFTGALLRIGRVLYRGDVEIHARVHSWRTHGHWKDPHYNRVILHVVYHGGPPGPPRRTASGRALPLLILSPYVPPAMFDTIDSACRGGPDEGLPCRNAIRTIARSAAAGVIRDLGSKRMERRVRILRGRLAQIIADREEPAGSDAWEQILYECIMEGMGYAGNRTPFLSLARAVPLSLLRRYGLGNRRAMQAILFGAAGLLPDPRAIRDPETRSYVRRLDRSWRSLRGAPGVHPLEDAEWKFFRLRPVNFPTARLAAICFLLPVFFTGHPIVRMLRILTRPGPPPRAGAFASMLTISPDGFWKRHRLFCRDGRGGGIALGDARVQELIVNGIIPVLLLLARVSGSRVVRNRTLELLRRLGPAAENSVTRRVRMALTDNVGDMRSPLEAQGMIHLFRVYCSRGRCRLCPLARRVRTSRRCSRGRTLTSSRR